MISAGYQQSNGIAYTDDMVDGVTDANDWHGNQGSRVSSGYIATPGEQFHQQILFSS